MFTGLIEEVGTVHNLQKGKNSMILTIDCTKVIEDAKIGDSIAINGVCLTVTERSGKQFSVDVMPETMKSTTLHELKKGSKVNLERAMAAGGRFGGHFVSGHVDGTGTIQSMKKEENAIYIYIQVPSDLMKYFMMKGSVAVDGTSLTVFDVTKNAFMISLIPQTADDTIIASKSPGSKVNIECDMIAKYVQNLIQPEQKGIDESYLRENGFM
ncbi:riboflavin synthase [Jeotgalibacillus alimentarius]|uniref:Riboflavin synthase n=1 Tax=Jeotgalibacillus alimentarius TaxID=135826 RepID=A0A0C2VWQ3_9BACL|nr:riboflavin synthase [Jeotgalibacillus alimentarius]KIL48836.1 riboflavin synthase [Jeotgalibacillus alimentarius]